VGDLRSGGVERGHGRSEQGKMVRGEERILLYLTIPQ
jgi:hypothetical protein